MARKKRKSLPWKPMVATLLGAGLLAFGIGELVLMTRSDTGRIRFARNFGFVDTPNLTRLIGRQLHQALAAANVAPDSLSETPTRGGAAGMRWRAGLTPEASMLQANYAITRTLEEAGASVLSGRESRDAQGRMRVTLLVGLPHRPTHEIVLVQSPRGDQPLEQRSARIAVVLYGFGDDGAATDSFFALPQPFAVALLPAGKASSAMFRAAHRRAREVVLLVPLEPINYPQVNPGPGTLLVTMKPTRIASELDRYLDQAAPVSAVANHMGSLATQDMTVMTAIYRELKRKKLPFVHLTPAAGAVCKSLASEMGVAYDEPDAVLDSEPRANDMRALDQRWKLLLPLAHQRQQLVVWVRATPLSYRWLPRVLDHKKLPGVDLVPLSSLIKKPSPI